jgi:segregation and condensation protein B
MNDSDLTQHIEALLFALGGSVSKKELAKKLEVSDAQVAGAILTLQGQMSGRGIVLVDDGTEVELRTAPQASQKIEALRKEDFSRDIGRAGLEVLAAILYRGPLSRSEIDFIRGVNSSQTVRTLLMRGFVRKVPNPKDERSFLYEPTTEILSHLGVVSMHDLPEYADVRGKLSALEEAYKNKEKEV